MLLSDQCRSPRPGERSRTHSFVSATACGSPLTDISLAIAIPDIPGDIDVDLSPRVGDFERHRRLFPFRFVVVCHAASPAGCDTDRGLKRGAGLRPVDEPHHVFFLVGLAGNTPQRHRNQPLIFRQQLAVQVLVSIHIWSHQFAPFGGGAGFSRNSTVRPAL